MDKDIHIFSHFVTSSGGGLQHVAEISALDVPRINKQSRNHLVIFKDGGLQRVALKSALSVDVSFSIQ